MFLYYVLETLSQILDGVIGVVILVYGVMISLANVFDSVTKNKVYNFNLICCITVHALLTKIDAFSIFFF